MPIEIAGSTTLEGEDRYYEYEGVKYPSVTTILKWGVPKPAMTKWRMNLVAQSAYENQEELAKKKSFETAKKFLIALAEAKMESGRAAIGTEVHALADTSALGLPSPIPSPEAAPFFDAYQAFQYDKKPEYLATELTVFNKTIGYAGTGDIWAVIDGKRALIDIKTGTNVWSEVALQLTAYKNAEFAVKDGNKVAAPRTERGYVLHLSEIGYKLKRCVIGDSSMAAFINALGMYQWFRDDSPFAIGGMEGEGTIE